MIPALRQRYNAAFTEQRYTAFLADLNKAVYWPVDFRVAESPLFFDEHTTRMLIRASDDIVGHDGGDQYGHDAEPDHEHSEKAKEDRSCNHGNDRN